ncbi:MAG: hypothetical protein GKR94_22975 [Gammaproteobacteria bacterium]|nr:hypothetical protein [Gammaproteobacteria bacterium]
MILQWTHDHAAEQPCIDELVQMIVEERRLVFGYAHIVRNVYGSVRISGERTDA